MRGSGFIFLPARYEGVVLSLMGVTDAHVPRDATVAEAKRREQQQEDGEKGSGGTGQSNKPHHKEEKGAREGAWVVSIKS
jgi:hypothetical protein